MKLTNLFLNRRRVYPRDLQCLPSTSIKIYWKVAGRERIMLLVYNKQVHVSQPWWFHKDAFPDLRVKCFNNTLI